MNDKVPVTAVVPLDRLIQTEEEEISLRQIFGVIVRHWKLIVVMPLILATLTGVWMLTRPRAFEAGLSFMPATRESPMSGAAGLARQFGVNLGTGSSELSPQFYVDLIRRPTILRQAVETEYTVTTEEGTRRGTLIDLYDVSGDDMWPAWQLAVTELRGNIVPSVNRQSGVIQVTVSAFQGSLAEQIAQRLLEIVTEFNLEARQERAQEEARFVGAQLEGERLQLLAAENQLQNFLSRNRVFQNSPQLMFEHERLERQVAMRQEVYTSLVAAHEQSRVDALRDTPVITIIDHPAGSAMPKARGTVARVVLAFIFGLGVATVLAFVLELVQSSRTEAARIPAGGRE